MFEGFGVQRKLVQESMGSQDPESKILYGCYYGYHVFGWLPDVMEVQEAWNCYFCKVFCGNPAVYTLWFSLLINT